jgi:hypothetical protein
MYMYLYPYLLVTILVLVPIPIHVPIPSNIRSWTEEAGCQARGILKRWVVRPVRNFSLGERIDGN